jgi:hypothetical protein
MLAVLVNGTTTMEKATAHAAKFDPSALHDLRRDWDGWSLWEQRAVLTLGVSSSLFGVFWLALSLKMMG